MKYRYELAQGLGLVALVARMNELGAEGYHVVNHEVIDLGMPGLAMIMGKIDLNDLPAQRASKAPLQRKRAP